MNASKGASMMIVTNGRNWPQMTAGALLLLSALIVPEIAFSQEFSEGNDGSSGWTRTSNPPVNSLRIDTYVPEIHGELGASKTASMNSRAARS